MKIIGVIPARFKSTRFEGKPLALIAGKPMIYWVYQQVSKVTAFDEIYVATEDERILKACEKYGMNCVMTADTHKTGTDRLGEVARKIEADFYVNIQGDEPMIEPETVASVIRSFEAHPEYDVFNTMTPIFEAEEIQSNSAVKVVANSRNEVMYFSRSPVPYPKNGQSIQYYRHLGLYGFKRDALMFFAETARGPVESIEDVEMLRYLENDIKIFIAEVSSQTIAVDHPEDIQKVEAAMKLAEGRKEQS
jgi:3-deoxy-manno-octulosonate cytidylyltransferase (CMP-KDO synthetase)